MAIKQLKNVSLNPITLNDIGVITLASNVTYEIPLDDWHLASKSTQLETYLNSEEIVVYDEFGLLTKAQGINWIKGSQNVRHAVTSAIHSATPHRLFYSDANGALQEVSFDTVNKAFLSNGAAVAPSFQQVDHTTLSNIGSNSHSTIDSKLHDRSHALTSTSDHTSGNWKVFYSNGSGQVLELGLGTAGQNLQSQGATSAPIWASTTARGGGIIAFGVNSSTAANMWMNNPFQADSSVSPYVTAYPITIIGISVVNTTTVTCSFQLYKNGSLIDTISLSGVTRATKLVSYGLVAGDDISVYISGTSKRPGYYITLA